MTRRRSRHQHTTALADRRPPRAHIVRALRAPQQAPELLHERRARRHDRGRAALLAIGLVLLLGLRLLREDAELGARGPRRVELPVMPARLEHARPARVRARALAQAVAPAVSSDGRWGPRHVHARLRGRRWGARRLRLRRSRSVRALASAVTIARYPEAPIARPGLREGGGRRRGAHGGRLEGEPGEVRGLGRREARELHAVVWLRGDGRLFLRAGRWLREVLRGRRARLLGGGGGWGVALVGRGVELAVGLEGELGAGEVARAVDALALHLLAREEVDGDKRVEAVRGVWGLLRGLADVRQREVRLRGRRGVHRGRGRGGRGREELAAVEVEA